MTNYDLRIALCINNYQDQRPDELDTSRGKEGFKMIVKKIMKQDIITLGPKDTISLALETMKKSKIRHIPIVNDNHFLVGLITERDIKDASPSIFKLDLKEHFLNKPIKDIMPTNIITGHPLDFVEEIAAILIENRIGCLPILLDRKLVGLITESDLLHTFIKLTGTDMQASMLINDLVAEGYHVLCPEMPENAK